MKETNKVANETAQQGDVLLRKLDSMPPGEQKLVACRHLVLAHGESGHSHVIDIEDDQATLIQIGHRMILEIDSMATVTHEEHDSITLSPGIWEVGRVKEYDYFSQMARPVQD